MSLHALAYCERLFYLEEVEEIRVADERVYAGRTLHEQIRAQEEEDGGEWTSRELSSEKLGLTGKADCLRKRDGELIPYEHKRGRAMRDGKKACAWPSDILQVCAYAMMLEEETGQTIAEARIRYHADNVTVRVPVDEQARQKVEAAIRRARQLRESASRPPVTANDRLCIRCSLAQVCLPEEERVVAKPQWEPLRLFPACREQVTLHVVKPGAHVSRCGDTLKVTVPEEGERTYPISRLGAVVLHGYAQITTQALHLCASHEIGVHWLSGQRFVAGLAPGGGAVQRKLRQYQALSDEKTRLVLAKKLVMAKVESGLKYLMRATRGFDRANGGIEKELDIIRKSLKAASHAEDVDELRGHEGIAGKSYFAVIPLLLHEGVPDAMVPKGRSRRPPKDRFNALLSFGYGLLYQAVLQAVVAVGLEPALGFFHKPRSAAHPLVLDLMELFRSPVWDMTVVASVNRGLWDAEEDFSISPGRVWLSETGRKKAIRLFEERLEETWKHPVIGYSLSYGRMIELETRLLEKEWCGTPGLFGRMRMR